jgi:hypothetical protein
MFDIIRITCDKDNIGTITRIETPDGRIVNRKDDQEFLDLDYLREFIGCEVLLVWAPRNNPEKPEKQDKLSRKLVAVKVDEQETERAGRTVYYLEFSEPIRAGRRDETDTDER